MSSNTKQYCTFYLKELFLGIEVEKIQEVLRFQELTYVPLANPVIGGLVNLRGQIVTAINLRYRFNFEDLPEDRYPMNVVIRTEDLAVSLLVDEIGDVLEVNKNTFEPPPKTLHGQYRELIKGVYKLDNQLLLILNTEETLNFPYS